MKAELLLSMFILLAILLCGCSAIPSMRYCDEVTYQRSGSKVTILAECTAPVGGM